MTTPPPHRRQLGFTLLEITLSISILVILISLIFGVMKSSITLSNVIVQEQEDTRHNAAQVNYLEQLFLNLSPESRILLEPNDHQLQSLIIERPNTSFPSEGRQHHAQQLTLDTLPAQEEDTDAMQLHLNLTNQVLEGIPLEDPHTFNAFLSKKSHHIMWEIYSPRENQWVTEWAQGMPLPSQIRLTMKHSDGTQQLAQHFWIIRRPQTPTSSQ